MLAWALSVVWLMFRGPESRKVAGAMKRVLAGIVVASVLSAVGACGGDDAEDSPVGFGPKADAGSTEGVDCTHPGAGRTIAGDRCECSTTLAIAGQWNGKRTCREGTTCLAQGQDESFRISQTGIDVRGEIGPSGSPTYTFTGKLCGDYLVWSGGPSSGENKECGQFRFSDDTHYVKDSCYVASGQCRADFGQGCPTEKGQCTATGAKSPETAPAIVKNVCD